MKFSFFFVRNWYNNNNNNDHNNHNNNNDHNNLQNRNAPRADIYELEVACNALVLTKMTLKSGGFDSFCLEGDDPTRQSRDTSNSEIVTLKDLDNRRACLQAELALLKHNSGTAITRMLILLLLFCCCKNVFHTYFN